MKKLVAALTVTALLTATNTPSASAGDKEWATAGKVLTGLLAASVLTDAVSSGRHQHRTSHTTFYTSPSYSRQTVVVQQPVIVQQPVYTHPQVIQQQVYVPQATYVRQPAVVYHQPVVVHQPACRTQPVVVHHPVVHRSHAVHRPTVSFHFGSGWSHSNQHRRHYGHSGRR
ncbi:hypothetical protein N9B94_01285 [Verrucomicrobia bacterium]|nr:hypothetical protein [Verrucomicrobiota bacterium]